MTARRGAACLTLAACLVGACGGGAGGGVPRITREALARPTLTLGPTSARFAVEVERAGRRARAQVLLDVSAAERGELLAWLRLVSVDAPEGAAALPEALRSPLADLEGVGFRWRMDSRGAIVAAGGPAAPDAGRDAATLRRGLELWTLVSATVPNLPDGPVAEGARWPAAQRTEVVGGGAERVVLVGGTWRLAKVLATAPATVVLEGDLRLEVRDPLLPPEEIEGKARVIAARAVVYVNLERRAVDFVTVASDVFSWQARRL